MKLSFMGLLICAITACSQQTQEFYVPGLGGFMAQLSYHHGKLWFAGQAQNWELAAYELDEVREGLAHISQYHPSHHKVKALPEQLSRYMTAPIQQTSAAIKAKEGQAFTVGYDAITGGCNACHQANGFGFNVLVKPTNNPYSNQQF